MTVIRKLFRRLFRPRPIRLPGTYPWKAPKPLPAGTVLIDCDPPIVADGKGGVTVLPFRSSRKPEGAFPRRTG
jgi:hypothetical protein